MNSLNSEKNTELHNIKIIELNNIGLGFGWVPYI